MTDDERAARAKGRAAVEAIVDPASSPADRLRALHSLRMAGKTDPFAAADLARELGEGLADDDLWSRRRLNSMKMLGRATEIGLARIARATRKGVSRDHQDPMRLVVATCISLIGSVTADRGSKNEGIAFLEMALGVFPGHPHALERLGIHGGD